MNFQSLFNFDFKMSKQKQKSNHVPTKSEKLFSSWGKNIAKGIVRTKQLAVQKIAKAPETPINDALKIKLQRYKYTKYEMIDISNIFNEMYQTKFNQKKNTDLLCRVFNNLYTNADADDKFGQFCHKMGTNLGKTIVCIFGFMDLYCYMCICTDILFLKI